MDTAPVFLSEDAIHELHEEQIVQFGGTRGIRDPDGLSAAISSPLHTFCYQPAVTLFDLAADYAFHISMSQAFLDGNKRTGLHAALTFLGVNGFDVEIDEQALYESIMRLHKGSDQRAALAATLRAGANIVPD